MHFFSNNKLIELKFNLSTLEEERSKMEQHFHDLLEDQRKYTERIIPLMRSQEDDFLKTTILKDIRGSLPPKYSLKFL